MALFIIVSQVAGVLLFVSASVRVSWYHSLVSVSVRHTLVDPDPVSLLFPTPLPCMCIVSPNPEIPWYVGGISTIFLGHCCLCLARCVCKFPHRKRDKHSRTVKCTCKPHQMTTIHLSACVNIAAVFLAEKLNRNSS